jgi:hypothetical protein
MAESGSPSSHGQHDPCAHGVSVTVIFVPYKGAMMQFRGTLTSGHTKTVKHIVFEGHMLINEMDEDGLVSSFHLLPSPESWNRIDGVRGHLSIVPNDPIYIKHGEAGSWVICSNSIPTDAQRPRVEQTVSAKKRRHPSEWNHEVQKAVNEQKGSGQRVDLIKANQVAKKRYKKAGSSALRDVRAVPPPSTPPSGGVAGSVVADILFG